MALLPLFRLSLTLLAVNSALSARIAGFVALGGSGYINMKQILEELASRGHEVALLVPSNRKIKLSDTVAHKVYQVRYKPGFPEEAFIPLDLEGRKLQFFWKVSEAQANLCDDALNSQEVLKELKGFDLLIYDCISFCGALVGEFLGIPRVELIPGQPNSPFNVPHTTPMPISYVPQQLLGFSDKMTFGERVMNFGGYLGAQLAWYLVINRNMNALKVKYNIRPERSFRETVGDAEMVIVTADFALEFPQPLLPDQVLVGALNAKDAKPLTPDLERVVSGSGEHGFIIVSFGSNVASILPRAEVDVLARAFGNLKQRVLWRLKGYIPSFLASNIKVMDWLPQNDLLGHKDIKAFVSHVGHNSMYEAAYHGVPVVAFPLFADQHANAKKVVNFGFGLSVDHQTVNVQQLQNTIELVVNEPRFKQRAKQISALLKDRRRTPLQESCDWIEYVLRHGGARHLRAQVFNIPWYQYYLLDVMAFLVAVVTFVVMVTLMTCSCICRLCCKRSATKPKKE